MALAAVAAGAALFANFTGTPDAVNAQAADVILDRTRDTGVEIRNFDGDTSKVGHEALAYGSLAQGFTTGNSSDHYAMSSIVIVTGGFSQPNDVPPTVTLHTGSPDGAKVSDLGDVAATIHDGLLTLTAKPSSGSVTLDADTTYHVVLHTGRVSPWVIDNGSGTDPGGITDFVGTADVGTADWSIEDTHGALPVRHEAVWRTDANALMIWVNADAVVAQIDSVTMFSDDNTRSGSPANGFYAVGGNVYFQVEFDRDVILESETVANLPTFRFQLAGEDREAASFLALNDPRRFGFNYTFTADDLDDIDGISWEANALQWNDGGLWTADPSGEQVYGANIEHDAAGQMPTTSLPRTPSFRASSS